MENAGKCVRIDGRMNTIIPRPVVNPPHCPAGFFFFVFICVHLFSFIVSLYGFASVVLILLVLFLWCSYYFCDVRIANAGVDCVQFVFIVGIRLSECYAGFVSFSLWRNQLFRVLARV